jgi:ACR3 family arsenite efflux pump ArsB
VDDGEVRVRVVALLCLAVVVTTSVVSIMIVALATDRSVSNAERLTAIVALTIPLLAGMSIMQLDRRRHRWRVEREDVNGGPGVR